MAEISPIRNWKELGLDPSEPYFNSGVMVMNLDRWRAEHIENKLLTCLEDNERFVICWDQYALNVVFSGSWGKLPAQWNQGSHVYSYPEASHSPIPSEEFIRMRDTPAIVHFTTQIKPWHYGSNHPLTETYFDALDQTEFRGWRPHRPRHNMRTVCAAVNRRSRLAAKWLIKRVLPRRFWRLQW